MSTKKAITNATADLMAREVSRAEFLRYTGVAIISAFGILNFAKNLNDIVPDKKKKISSNNKHGGYGSSAYGG